MIMTLLAWVFALNNNPKRVWAAFSAISFTALTLLTEYRLVLDWVAKEDWSAMLDVVPSMYQVLCIYTIIMILMNGAALFIKNKKKDR